MTAGSLCPQVLYAERWGLEPCALPVVVNVAATHCDTLDFSPLDESSSLIFYSVSKHARGGHRRARELQAGTPLGLMAYLYSRWGSPVTPRAARADAREVGGRGRGLTLSEPPRSYAERFPPGSELTPPHAGLLACRASRPQATPGTPWAPPLSTAPPPPVTCAPRDGCIFTAGGSGREHCPGSADTLGEATRPVHSHPCLRDPGPQHPPPRPPCLQTQPRVLRGLLGCTRTRTRRTHTAQPRTRSHRLPLRRTPPRTASGAQAGAGGLRPRSDRLALHSGAFLEGYVQQFLYTFRYFCTPQDLLHFLLDRISSALPR